MHYSFGGINMVFKKGKKGGKRRYGRRFAGGVRRGGSRVLRAFGINKSSFHVSNAVIMGGAIATMVLPATSDPNSSVIGILSGKGTYATQTWAQRMENAGNAAMVVGLGKGKAGTTYTNVGTGGALVVGGLGMKIVGKFTNGPFFAGSPIKL